LACSLKVSPEVRAASAKAVAEWEALRASAHSTRSEHASGSREGAIDLSRGQLGQDHASSHSNAWVLGVATPKQRSTRLRQNMDQRQGGTRPSGSVRAGLGADSGRSNTGP